MRVFRQAADRMVSLFVPKITASALWYWSCLSEGCQNSNEGSRPVCGHRDYKWCSWCHDSGFCYPPEIRCC